MKPQWQRRQARMEWTALYLADGRRVRVVKVDPSPRHRMPRKVTF